MACSGFENLMMHLRNTSQESHISSLLQTIKRPLAWLMSHSSRAAVTTGTSITQMKEVGQILLCISGRGWYQEWGKEAVELHPGDVITIPREVKHWHGAAKDSWFSHIAVEVPGENTRNEWCEAVSDEVYGALKVLETSETDEIYSRLHSGLLMKNR